MDHLSLLTAFTIGLFGGAHCIGMCGGVMGALTLAVKPEEYVRRLQLVLAYNVGRISSYVLIAIGFYLLLAPLQYYFSWQFMRIVAGLLLVAMGLYLANWWRGLTYLEKLGGYVWRWVQPLSKPLIPVKSIWQAVVMGLIWGWLPCGLIYSALAYSATASSVGSAALVMFSFALGTLPAVMVSGLFAERLMQLIQQQALRTVMALLIIVFGLWTLSTVLLHDHAGGTSGHQHSLTPSLRY